MEAKLTIKNKIVDLRLEKHTYDLNVFRLRFRSKKTILFTMMIFLPIIRSLIFVTCVG